MAGKTSRQGDQSIIFRENAEASACLNTSSAVINLEEAVSKISLSDRCARAQLLPSGHVPEGILVWMYFGFALAMRELRFKRKG